jgi:predicted permease
MPLMILASFNINFTWDKLYNAGYLVGLSLVVHIALYFISRFVFPGYTDDIKSVLRYTMVFSNAGFMGFPVVEALFGKTGLFYASIYLMPYRILMWTLGVALFLKGGSKGSMKKILLNPSIITTFLGIIIFLSPVKIPEVLNSAFDMVGSTTTPLSMIVIGALVADVKFKEVFSGFAVFYLSFIRLIALPVLVFFILRLFNANKIVIDIMTILTAMPAGTMTAMLSERYGGNSSFASKCVFVTTALSTVTIPLIVMLLK